MAIAPGIWLLNPPRAGGKKKTKKNSKKYFKKSRLVSGRKKKRSASHKKRNPKRTLEIRLNAGGKKSVAKKRRKKHYRRRKNVTRTLYRANAPKRRRKNSPHRRKKYYRRRKNTVAAAKPTYKRRRRNYGGKRKNYYRRKRNPSLVGRTTGTIKGLLSSQRLLQVGSALVGFGGTELAEQFIPIPATSQLALYGKKVLAAAGVYMIASMFIKDRTHRQAVALGAMLNIAVDALRQFMPDISGKIGFSGYGEDGLLPTPGHGSLPARLESAMAIPTLAN